MIVERILLLDLLVRAGNDQGRRFQGTFLGLDPGGEVVLLLQDVFSATPLQQTLFLDAPQ